MSFPTVVPTLSEGDARKELLDLLTTNGGCQLPCLWGITPGSSAYQNAQATLLRLSSLSEITGFSTGLGSVSPGYTEGNYFINTNVNFLSENEIVTFISFRVQILQKIVASNGEPSFLGVFEVTPFGKHIEYYMLSNLLAQLGTPASVVISTSANPNPRGQGGFDIVVLYPEQGVAAHYTTKGYLIEENVKGCFSSAFVEFELYPSGDAASFSNDLTAFSWARFWPGPNDTPYWKQLEKSTNMSLKEFYEVFREPTDKCIETPASLWPVQEP